MSEENLEIARRFYDAPSPDDPIALQAFQDLLDPEIDWEVVSDGPRLVFEGIPAVMQFLYDWHRGFDELQMEPEEFIEVGNDQVVVLVHQHGRMKGGSGQVEERTAHILTMSNGRIVRFQGFLRREQGLQAAGLSE